MKNIILTATLALCALSLNAANDGKLRIKSTIKDCDSLIVCISTPRGTDVVDTMVMRNGKAECEISLDQARSIILASPAACRGERIMYELTMLPGIPGETLEVSGHLPLPIITGSAFYRQEGEMKEALRPQMQARMDLETFIEEGIAKGRNEAELVEEHKEMEPRVVQDLQNAIMSFIRQHPDNEASPEMLYPLADMKLIDKAISLFKDHVKNGPMKVLYEPMVEMMRSSYAEMDKAANSPLGKVAPDFTLKDINGKSFTLSSLRGKYVLLDFWGTWCGVCIKGFPQLRVNQKKYENKLTVIGVDCGDTEEKWKEGLKKYNLPWMQVYNPRNSSVLKEYNIDAFPTKILISPEGIILKCVTGDDTAFFDDFDSILNS